MRTITYLLACAFMGSVVVGCESAETRATAKLRQAVDEASRLHQAAIVLLGQPLPSDKESGVAQGLMNPAILAKLQQADGILTEALGSAPEASPAIQVPAQALLADILTAKGDYHAGLARLRMARVLNHLGLMDRQINEAQTCAALTKHFHDLANMDTSSAASMKQKAQARRDELAGKKKDLDGQQATLTDKIAALDKEGEGKLTQAAELRSKARTVSSAEAVTAIREAGQLERQAQENKSNSDAVKLDLEMNRNSLAQLNAELASVEAELKSMGDRTTALGDATAKYQGYEKDQDAKTKQAWSSLGAATKEMAAELDAMAKAADAAEAEYDRASKAAAKPATGEVAGVVPQPTMDKCEALSRKGAIALARGALGQEKLEAASRVQALAKRADEVAKALSADSPGELAAAVKALGDTAAVKASAEKAFQEAGDAFASSATEMKRGGMDKARWVVEGQQARALLGQYWLTTDKAKLAEAKTLVSGILQGRENDTSSTMQSVRSLSALLDAEG